MNGNRKEDTLVRTHINYILYEHYNESRQGETKNQQQ
jgi:hypothetical protein